MKPGMFRIVGGGRALCPGRYLTTAELTLIVAMLAIRTGIYPVATEGRKKQRGATNYGAICVAARAQSQNKAYEKRGIWAL